MKNLLIVDDDELTLGLYDLLLEGMEGVTFQTAENGTVALEYLERKFPDQWPDLIFIDLHMPDMDGYEFVEKYQEKFKTGKKECQLFFLTSSVSHRDQEKVKEYSIITDMLSKPLTEEGLNKLIHSPEHHTPSEK